MRLRAVIRCGIKCALARSRPADCQRGLSWAGKPCITRQMRRLPVRTSAGRRSIEVVCEVEAAAAKAANKHQLCDVICMWASSETNGSSGRNLQLKELGNK